MHTLSRRRVLCSLPILAAGCGSNARGGDCVDGPGSGEGTYCVVEGLVVRVFGATSLPEGAAVLANVDESTAVIVSRDADGWFARSAICTHTCCIVSLCADSGCGVLTSTPEACGSEEVERTDRVLCPCHGSTFRLSDGVPLDGPATVPLPAYAVSLDAAAGDVLVDTGRTVDPAQRVS